MSTELTWQTASTSLDDTVNLGVKIGELLRGGEVLELRSDVGGGKTAFVRGLAQGMGSDEVVRSPSFTIANRYKTKATKAWLYHFDFYRLTDPGIMRQEIAEVLENPALVVVVEWAAIVENVLPADHITVTISVTGESSRQFAFEYPEKFSYLFPET